MRVFGPALAACLLACSAHAAVRGVQLHPPARDFGYFLGDVLTATAIVDVDAGTALDRSSVPAPGPVAALIDIRRVDVRARASGGGTRYDITIEYQSFYGPDAATHTSVPPYRLDFTDGARHFSASVPGWSFMASALRHEVTAMTDPRGLRGDHAVAWPDDRAAWWRLYGAIGVALAALLVWLAGRGWIVLPGSRHPFGHAMRDVRRILRGPGDAAAQRAALLALHRAFDATAGEAMLAGDIDRFIGAHARFGGLRPDLEHFFAVSQRCFFSDGGENAPVDRDWLLGFGRRLRRAERG